MAEGMRQAEPGVRQPEDRQPRTQLALQAMLQLLGPGRRQARGKMLEEHRQPARGDRFAERMLTRRVDRLDSVIESAHAACRP